MRIKIIVFVIAVFAAFFLQRNHANALREIPNKPTTITAKEYYEDRFKRVELVFSGITGKKLDGYGTPVTVTRIYKSPWPDLKIGGTVILNSFAPKSTASIWEKIKWRLERLYLAEPRVSGRSFDPDQEYLIFAWNPQKDNSSFYANARSDELSVNWRLSALRQKGAEAFSKEEKWGNVFSGRAVSIEQDGLLNLVVLFDKTEQLFSVVSQPNPGKMKRLKVFVHRSNLCRYKLEEGENYLVYLKYAKGTDDSGEYPPTECRNIFALNQSGILEQIAKNSKQ